MTITLYPTTRLGKLLLKCGLIEPTKLHIGLDAGKFIVKSNKPKILGNTTFEFETAIAIELIQKNTEIQRRKGVESANATTTFMQ